MPPHLKGVLDDHQRPTWSCRAGLIMPLVHNRGDVAAVARVPQAFVRLRVNARKGSVTAVP
jgi:hypothetical protein